LPDFSITWRTREADRQRGEARHRRQAAGAIRALDYGEAKLATALNGEFAPARARAATHMKEGDRIEILAPRGGGT
jgi:sulfur carrier protein